MKLKLLLLGILSQLNVSGQHLSPDDTDTWKMKANDGVRLYVTEFGKGDTVVVLHGGFGAEHGYMVSAVAPFTGQHHFVLYDQRGSLRSDCADSLITLANHVEDLETLRQKLGLSQLTLFTHSMGGFIAMNYIQKYPGRVKKLVMVCPPPARSSFEELTSGIQGPALARWDRKEVTAELNKYGLKKELAQGATDQQKWVWDRITFAAINLNNVKHWRQIEGGPLYFSNKAGIATVRSLPFTTWDFTETLDKEHIPIHVVEGDDNYVPYRYNENWPKQLQNGKFYLIRNAGHVAWLDNMPEYRKIMLQVL